ncbi:endopeptidase [Priestia megaterium]|nr:endopeptidase [Priestia megaterium]
MKKMLTALVMGGMLVSIPLIGEAAPNDQVLKQGMKSKSVEQVKVVLKEKEFLDGQVSTYFNYETKVAVQDFQKEHDLQVDGIVGPNTYKALGMTGSAVKGEADYDVNAVISKAKSLIGTPYKWGGTTPDGFDCSGFLQYVFKESVDVALPRTVEQMYNAGEGVREPSAGDIVYFKTYKEGPSHAGIYLGDGKFIHASSSKGVTISDKNSSYWKERYIGAKKATVN